MALPARAPQPPIQPEQPIQIRKENWYRLVHAFLEEQRRANKTAKTVQTRREGLEDFARYLRAQGVTLNVGEVTREHVGAYMTDQLHARRLAASSANLHLACLKMFFNWLVEDGEIERSPCARVTNAIAPEEPPDVLSEADLQKLWATCQRGTDFYSRRDYAILRVLLSVGGRRAEVGNLSVEDVEWDEREVKLFGKARKHRGVNFGHEASRALRHYMRARDRFQGGKWTNDPHLWIGLHGPLKYHGLYQIVRRRGQEAGLDKTHPHLFRHTAAYLWKAAGGSEIGLRKRMGWRPGSKMGDRYGAKMDEELSKREYDRLTPDDNM